MCLACWPAGSLVPKILRGCRHGPPCAAHAGVRMEVGRRCAPCRLRIECQPARRGPAGGPADDRPDPTALPTPDPDPPPNAWDGRAGRPSQAAPQSLPSRPQRHARMPSTPAAAAAIQVKPTQGGAPGQAGDATSGQTGALGARRDPAGAAPVCPGAATVNQAVSPSTKRSHCQPSTAPAKKQTPAWQAMQGQDTTAGSGRRRDARRSQPRLLTRLLLPRPRPPGAPDGPPAPCRPWARCRPGGSPSSARAYSRHCGSCSAGRVLRTA